MKSQKSAEMLALACVALLVLTILGAAGTYIFRKHQWAQDRLNELEPRYSRLLGLDAQRQEIEAALTTARTARAKYVYPASQEATQAGNAAQQQIRDVLTSAGLQISSSQVLPPKTGKGYDRIPITVRAEGEWLSVQSALSVLASQAPIVVIDEFEVQIIGGLGNTIPKFHPKLAVYFAFSALKEHP
ncbi:MULTISPECIES: type II secretion system protein GspM [unclassified Acidovorax]|uniref:type II secretion system protein GspM n=1 Tax=unclassified Acidovorax TaxID=2684926 RepID=UPI0037C53234